MRSQVPNFTKLLAFLVNRSPVETSTGFSRIRAQSQSLFRKHLPSPKVDHVEERKPW